MDRQSQNMPQPIGDAGFVPDPVAAAAPYQVTNQQYLYLQQQQEQQQQQQQRREQQQQQQQRREQQQQQQLRAFWADQYRDIKQTKNFKNHSVPLARIKRIMKADEDVHMISAEAPVVLARACEMFTFELTRRAWTHAEENNRRTLQRNDIAAAIQRTEIFDFLVSIVPTEEGRDDGAPKAIAGGPFDSLQRNNN